MNKLIILLVFFAGFSLSQTLHAQDRTFGLGGMVGDPTGVSAKIWFSEDNAIAGGLSFGLADEISFFWLTADFLFHRPFDINWEAGSLHSYYGPGLSYYSGSRNDEISIRAPLGLGFNFTEVPVEIFFEVVPYIDIDPEFFFSFMGGAGFRFYLK